MGHDVAEKKNGFYRKEKGECFLRGRNQQESASGKTLQRGVSCKEYFGSLHVACVSWVPWPCRATIYSLDKYLGGRLQGSIVSKMHRISSLVEL